MKRYEHNYVVCYQWDDIGKSTNMRLITETETPNKKDFDMLIEKDNRKLPYVITSYCKFIID